MHKIVKFRRVKIRKKPLPKEKIVFFILVGLIFLYFTISIFNEVNSVNVGRAISEEQENLIAEIRTVIEIDNAEHLDSNRNFISDIYNEVKELDDIWSEEIPNGDYIRVTFEEELTSESDITLYPRIVSGTPKIEIYEIDGTELIAEFTSLNDNKYNKVYLTGLEGAQDVFDLRVVGGSLKFEHIVDPPISLQEYLKGGGLTITN